MKVYVASSWRNTDQPDIVNALRLEGHEIYDFRHPQEGDDGFTWMEIDPTWEKWDSLEFIDALKHPAAVRGFNLDMDALKWADALVLVMPCGRSAHLELGYAVGAGKPTAILLTTGEPELMYKMVDLLTGDLTDIADWLDQMEAQDAR